ncbi:MAG: inositol-1-monophosphatase [Gammaproteobacteria bacterium]|nr:inositol-1-monophosphatase [Gammaproteobacteria bacterium]MDH5593197.1 inositol-1-monophosphatase [Gammaproteobacteria bacterium]
MHPMLNIAIRAARSAGNIIVRSLDRLDTLTIETKSSRDFVTEVDRQAEQEIIATIRKSYPDHGFLAEESGESGSDEFQWIIDPLDGTTNFLHGFPQFAVSIALKHKGKLEQAVVYNPVSEELFTATRGAGALLNDRRIRVSKVHKFENALLGTGFPFKDLTHIEPFLNILKDVLSQSSGVRRPGSASLDLAYVAAGRLDGFWEFGLQPWDMAAGILLVQEAGGLISDFRGGNNFMQSGNIVAANPKIFKILLQSLHNHIPAELDK